MTTEIQITHAGINENNAFQVNGVCAVGTEKGVHVVWFDVDTLALEMYRYANVRGLRFADAGNRIPNCGIGFEQAKFINAYMGS